MQTACICTSYSPPPHVQVILRSREQVGGRADRTQPQPEAVLRVVDVDLNLDRISPLLSRIAGLATQRRPGPETPAAVNSCEDRRRRPPVPVCHFHCDERRTFRLSARLDSCHSLADPDFKSQTRCWNIAEFALSPFLVRVCSSCSLPASPSMTRL
ncbi:hypothetical protein VTI74DRAFT_239 [Chaetomium olivicolor]